ncbi:MAG: hypothetical protein ACKOJF_14950, partial [Planctomycetaceae bacterium]
MANAKFAVLGECATRQTFGPSGLGTFGPARPVDGELASSPGGRTQQILTDLQQQKTQLDEQITALQQQQTLLKEEITYWQSRQNHLE